MARWFYEYETVYAERIDEALGKRELGDMTPEWPAPGSVDTRLS
jgi:hypothetical protein